MATKLITKKERSGVLDFTMTMNYYRSKFFAVFMNKFEVEGLTYDQKRFLLTQLWERGTINAFILQGSKPLSLVLQDEEENPNGLLILTPYAPFEYNIYNYPTKLVAVRLRGATFIPTTPMMVGKDCVIGWGHTSHQPIRDLVEYYVIRIANVEGAIQQQVFGHKMPRLIVCSPEDKDRLKGVVNAIENGENVLYVDAMDFNAIKNVLDGGSYIIDKLYSYKTALENELLTILGIDNNGVDKRERRVVDEVNANNAIINDGNDTFMSELEEFVRQVNDILGYPLSIKAKEVPVASIYEDEVGSQDDDLGGDEE